MALDTAALTAGYGWVLIRKNLSTSEEWIVDWANGDMDEMIDSPGPGTFSYTIKMILGATASSSGGYFVQDVTYGQTGYSTLGQIVVQELRR